MKISLKFREEEIPLLRTKVALKLGPIPVISSLAVGTKQDLALQFATSFSFGPILKLCFKPHDDPNAISLVLKSGFGSWGCPNGSPIMLAAGMGLSPRKVQEPYFSLRIEPTFGDFGIRKSIQNVSLLPAQQNELKASSMPLSVYESDEQSHAMSTKKDENDCLTRSISNRDENTDFEKTNGYSFDKDRIPAPHMHFGNISNGSNVSKVEHFENRSQDQKAKLERVDEVDGESQPSVLEKGLTAHERLYGKARMSCCKFTRLFSLARAEDAFKGCKIVTHSSLPLGSHSKINIRWLADADLGFVRGWDGSLPGLCLSKLPSLVFEKISFEQVATHAEKTSAGNRIEELSDQGLPNSFIKENRELAQVAALCNVMKRHTHLMHAENQVLRRAMEDINFHVDSKSSSWILNGIPENKLKDSGFSTSRLSQMSSNLNGSPLSRLGGEDVNRDVQAHKSKKSIPKWEESSSKHTSKETVNDCVSKELEKAILEAQAGSNDSVKKE